MTRGKGNGVHPAGYAPFASGHTSTTPRYPNPTLGYPQPTPSYPQPTPEYGVAALDTAFFPQQSTKPYGYPLWFDQQQPAPTYFQPNLNLLGPGPPYLQDGNNLWQAGLPTSLCGREEAIQPPQCPPYLSANITDLQQPNHPAESRWHNPETSLELGIPENELQWVGSSEIPFQPQIFEATPQQWPILQPQFFQGNPEIQSQFDTSQTPPQWRSNGTMPLWSTPQPPPLWYVSGQLPPVQVSAETHTLEAQTQLQASQASLQLPTDRAGPLWHHPDVTQPLFVSSDPQMRTFSSPLQVFIADDSPEWNFPAATLLMRMPGPTPQWCANDAQHQMRYPETSNQQRSHEAPFQLQASEAYQFQHAPDPTRLPHIPGVPPQLRFQAPPTAFRNFSMPFQACATEAALKLRMAQAQKNNRAREEPRVKCDPETSPQICVLETPLPQHTSQLSDGDCTPEQSPQLISPPAPSDLLDSDVSQNICTPEISSEISPPDSPIANGASEPVAKLLKYIPLDNENRCPGANEQSTSDVQPLLNNFQVPLNVCPPDFPSNVCSPEVPGKLQTAETPDEPDILKLTSQTLQRPSSFEVPSNLCIPGLALNMCPQEFSNKIRATEAAQKLEIAKSHIQNSVESTKASQKLPISEAMLHNPEVEGPNELCNTESPLRSAEPIPDRCQSMPSRKLCTIQPTSRTCDRVLPNKIQNNAPPLHLHYVDTSSLQCTSTPSELSSSKLQPNSPEDSLLLRGSESARRLNSASPSMNLNSSQTVIKPENLDNHLESFDSNTTHDIHMPDELHSPRKSQEPEKFSKAAPLLSRTKAQLLLQSFKANFVQTAPVRSSPLGFSKALSQQCVPSTSQLQQTSQLPQSGSIFTSKSKLQKTEDNNSRTVMDLSTRNCETSNIQSARTNIASTALSGEDAGDFLDCDGLSDDLESDDSSTSLTRKKCIPNLFDEAIGGDACQLEGPVVMPHREGRSKGNEEETDSDDSNDENDSATFQETLLSEFSSTSKNFDLKDILLFKRSGVCPAHIEDRYTFRRQAERFHLENDQLFYTATSDGLPVTRLAVVEETVRFQLINCAHEDNFTEEPVHKREEEVIRDLTDKYFWPDMAADIHRYIGSCEHCRNVFHAALLNLAECPYRDFEPDGLIRFVEVDLLRFPTIVDSKKYAVIITDDSNKFAAVMSVKQRSACQVAVVIQRIVNRFKRLFEVQINSQSIPFASELALELRRLTGYSLRVTAAHRLQRNGYVEMQNEIMMQKFYERMLETRRKRK